MNFEKLQAYQDSLHEAGVPGCDLVVFQDHQLIYRHQAGFRDAGKKIPMNGRERFWLFSCTKLITTCAVMQWVEKEKIGLDDPVSVYLPSFGHLTVKEGEGKRSARHEMTIRHLMSMQSGLSYDLNMPSIREVIRRTHGQASTMEIIQALPEDPLSFDPGTDFLYSLSHDVLAAVVEKVSGKRFSDCLKEQIFDPLDLHGFTFRLGEPEKMDLCALYCMEEEKAVLQEQDSNNYQLTKNYESGGAGLIGRTDDMIRFLDVLACGGEAGNGTMILSPEMIQLWRANQLGPRSRKSFDQWNRRGYSYGLGVRTRVNDAIGGKGPLGEFGWDGAAGSWAMIDCEHHVSAFYGMHVRNFGYVYDVIHPTLRNLIYEGLEA